MLSSILEIALIAQQFDLLEPVLNFGSSILETGSSALASAV